MSEYTDFYPTWLGTSMFGSAGVKIREIVPISFQPTDISGCALWLDADDNIAVSTNSFNIVQSWANKGYVGGQFDLSGTEAILYGSTLINGLNAVSFTSNSFMSGTFSFPFDARSIFFVARENGVPANTANPWFSSDTNGGVETFSFHNGTTTYFIGKHPSPYPELAFEATKDYVGTAVLTEFINSASNVDNWGGINGTEYPLIYSANASGYNQSSITYFLGGYFGGSTIASSQDFCEAIMYNTSLQPEDRQRVEQYLINRWAITEPPAPPVPPSTITFSPLDISGCAIWLDANQGVTLDLSGNVGSWANLGFVSTTYDQEVGIVSVNVDKNGMSTIQFDGNTTLSNYSQLPYVSRTIFTVFENLSLLDTISYPYINLMNTSVETGRQVGVAYDSNTSNYFWSICQQGQNCPVSAQLPVPLGTGDRNLGIAVILSNSAPSTLGFFNGGSNINTSTDIGNLFSTNPIPYQIGSPVSGSPDFRMAEYIEYNSYLDNVQISTVADYLVNKWAISSFNTLVFPS